MCVLYSIDRTSPKSKRHHQQQRRAIPRGFVLLLGHRAEVEAMAASPVNKVISGHNTSEAKKQQKASTGAAGCPIATRHPSCPCFPLSAVLGAQITPTKNVQCQTPRDVATGRGTFARNGKACRTQLHQQHATLGVQNTRLKNTLGSNWLNELPQPDNFFFWHNENVMM